MQLILRGVLALLSLPCIALYFHFVWIWYLQHLGHLELWHTSTKLYIFALFLHMACIIPPYKSGELFIFGIPTGKWLGAGPWLIPNILHITITLTHWALLGRVVVVTEEFDDPGPAHIHHHVDTRESMHLIQTDAGLVKVALFRGASRIVDFLVGYKKGSAHETVSRLGFRIMLAAAVWAWWANDRSHEVIPVKDPLVEYFVTSPATQAPQAKHEELPASTPQTASVSPPLRVLVPDRKAVINLSAGLEPLDLAEEEFAAQNEKEHRYCATNTPDPRKYCRYNSLTPDHVDEWSAGKMSCLRIPKGRSVFFFTSTPPTNAVNMEEEVTFTPAWWAPWSDGKAQWRILEQIWWQVDTRHPIKGTSIPESHFPQGEYGSIVCF